MEIEFLLSVNNQNSHPKGVVWSFLFLHFDRLWAQRLRNMEQKKENPFSCENFASDETTYIWKERCNSLLQSYNRIQIFTLKNVLPFVAVNPSISIWWQPTGALGSTSASLANKQDLDFWFLWLLLLWISCFHFWRGEMTCFFSLCNFNLQHLSSMCTNINWTMNR